MTAEMEYTLDCKDTSSSSEASEESDTITSLEYVDPLCDPNNPLSIKFSDISTAAFNIRDGIVRTPSVKSNRLSEMFGMEIFLKKEYLQVTGSFKERGARFAMMRMSAKEKQIGVVAASAGNHALALALHGSLLGIPVTVVMPEFAPLMKISSCVSYGANVILHGKNIQKSKEFAYELSRTKGLKYINGFDNPDVIAGQGTIGLEILEQASLGWLEKFIKRHNFRLRVPTTVCQKPPSDYAQKLVDFIIYVSHLRTKNNYQTIFACDETAVWLDPAGGKCIDERGAKEVSVLTTGHEKMRVTVMLTASSDGRKLKPFVLMPRKRPVIAIAKKYKGRLELCWKGTNWMNDELTGNYLNNTFGRSLFGKRLLIWDSFRCHISEATKKKLKEINMHSAVVPGGCTKFIQAPDVVWNAPFKAKVQELYNNWMLNDADKEWTVNGNPRPPSMNIWLDWICQAWDALPREMIAKSFKDCGITNALCGDEDNVIHCFKDHGPVPEGMQMLQDARFAAIDDMPATEEIDADQNQENGYVSDESLDIEL